MKNSFKFVVLAIYFLSSLKVYAENSGRGGDNEILNGVFEQEKAQNQQKHFSDLMTELMTLQNLYLNEKLMKDPSGILNGYVMRKRILQALNDPTFREYVPERSQSILQTLGKDLIEDAEKSPYGFKELCIDEKGRKKPLVTKLGVKKDNICVSTKTFFEKYYKDKPPVFEPQNPHNSKSTFIQNSAYTAVPVWQLFGLFVHDNARHLGLADESHHFATDMAQAYYEYDAVRFDQSETYDKRIWLTSISSIMDNKQLRFDIELDPNSECVKENGQIRYTRTDYHYEKWIDAKQIKFSGDGNVLSCFQKMRTPLSMKGAKIVIFADEKSSEQSRLLYSDSVQSDSKAIIIRVDEAIVEFNGLLREKSPRPIYWDEYHTHIDLPMGWLSKLKKSHLRVPGF